MHILPQELHSSTFSMRMWFRSSKKKTIMTKGLPSGLHVSISDQVKFLPDGTVAGLPSQYAGAEYALNGDGRISFGRLSIQDAPVGMLEVRKRPDWGWELRSGAYVFRSITDKAVSGNNGDDLLKKLWMDLSSKIVIEIRKKDVQCYRIGKGRKYKRREVPDMQELKSYLCLLYTSPSPRDVEESRMPSSA